MAKRCTDCGGRGVWQESIERGGEVQVEQKYCNTCRGKGYVVVEEELDDFDLAGVGTTEDDDDEL